jgi:hypothetical protein
MIPSTSANLERHFKTSGKLTFEGATDKSFMNIQTSQTSPTNFISWYKLWNNVRTTPSKLSAVFAALHCILLPPSVIAILNITRQCL